MSWKVISMLLLVGVLSTASAHGGEDSLQQEQISSGQVLLISGIGALALWQATSAVISVRADGFSPMMVALAGYSSLVHLMLGLQDTLLLVGGFGLMVGLVALVVLDLGKQRHRLIQFAMGAGVLVMLIGYFASNHDLHAFAEDRLGITTKIAELAFLGLLYRSLFTAEKQARA
ncbi:MAG: hypothetical protein ACPGKR_03155 [Poseidonia sp.]